MSVVRLWLPPKEEPENIRPGCFYVDPDGVVCVAIEITVEKIIFLFRVDTGTNIAAFGKESPVPFGWKRLPPGTEIRITV